MRLLLILNLYFFITFGLYAQEQVLDETKLILADNYYIKAKSDYEIKNYKSSLSFFSKAYAINNNNSDYAYGVATSFYEFNEYDSALVYILKAIELEPKQPDYHLRAGNIYFKKRDYAKAISNYNITLNNLSEEYPINILSCYYNLAVSHYYLKNYTESISALTEVIKEDNEDYNAIHLRGVSYFRLNEKTKGCQDLQKAYSLGNLKSKEYLDKYCNTNN